MAKRGWTDEELRNSLAKNITISGTLRSMGLSVSPGNFRTIGFYIKKLGLDTRHLKGMAHGTSGAVKQIPLDKILVKDSTYLNTTHLKRRLLKEKLLSNICTICKLDDTWQSLPITLQLDHINGDPSDNRLENLRILCPNCHSQTPTFTSNNRKGRYRKTLTLCVNCQKVISKGSVRCLSCMGKKQLKIQWPPAEDLYKEVEQTSLTMVGKRLGVKDNSIKKYLKKQLGKFPRKHKPK